MLKIKTVKLTH